MRYLLALCILFSSVPVYAQKCSDNCADKAAEATAKKPKEDKKPKDDPFRELLRPKKTKPKLDTKLPELPWHL